MNFLHVPQAYAACEAGPDGSIPLDSCLTLSTGQKVSEVFSTPADIVNLLVQYAFIAAGILLFFMFLYAGFMFIQNGSKGKDQARDVLTTALIGIIVMFSAYWVVQIVQTVTGTQIGL